QTHQDRRPGDRQCETVLPHGTASPGTKAEVDCCIISGPVICTKDMIAERPAWLLGDRTFAVLGPHFRAGVRLLPGILHWHRSCTEEGGGGPQGVYCMVVASQFQAIQSATGIVEEVDVPARTVRVLVDGVSRTFDVASDCVIHLYGEPVKLRLLQPRDVVHILFTATDDTNVAHALQANWWLVQRGA